MGELEETSLILNMATKKSLVLLDELVNKINCTTLFVTHFKCLTQIFPKSQVISGHMGFLKEEDNEEDVLFLYKLSPGSASNSFGINVAKMAELPESIVK